MVKTTTFKDPSKETVDTLMSDVVATMGLQVNIHIMRDGKIALAVKCDTGAPADFKEFLKLPVNDMKLHAVKAEIMGALTRFQPSDRLVDVLASDDSMLAKAIGLANAGEACDCPACMAEAEAEAGDCVKH